MTFATVREAHDHAMERMDVALNPSTSIQAAQRARLDALLAEAEAVRLSFERETSVATRHVLVRSLRHIAKELADHVGYRVSHCERCEES